MKSQANDGRSATRRGHALVGLALGVATMLSAWADEAGTRTRAVGAEPMPAAGASVTCPPGLFLYAMDVLHGAWLDHAGPLCVQIENSGSWVASTIRTSVGRVNFERDGDPRAVAAGLGGTGGEFQSELACPRDTLVVGFEAVIVADRQFVGRLNLLCRARDAGEELRVAMGPPDPNHPTITYSAIRCPPGFVANGLYGDGGQYVQRIGLTCADDPRSHRVTQADFSERRAMTSRLELDARRASRLRGAGTTRESPVALPPPSAAGPPPADVPAPPPPGPPQSGAAVPERFTATFAPPMARGRARLAVCLDGAGTRCGQAAADAFCQQSGYATAIAFQPQDAAPGTSVRTLSGAACAAKACRIFRSIDCADR